MSRILEIEDYKIVTEENKHHAHKAMLFRNNKLCSESYGQTEYEAIIKTIRPMCSEMSTPTALLIMLLQIGFVDGYEGTDIDIEVYQNEFKELYLDTKL